MMRKILCVALSGILLLAENTAVSAMDMQSEQETATACLWERDAASTHDTAIWGSGPPVPLCESGYLTNGEPVTEENVLELLRQIEQDWPTGTVWGTDKTPGTCKNDVPSTASGQIMQSYRVSNIYGCGAYASMVSSLIFGDETNPGRKLEDLSQIRPGDIIFRVRNDNDRIWHVTIALESPNEKTDFRLQTATPAGWFNGRTARAPTAVWTTWTATGAKTGPITWRSGHATLKTFPGPETVRMYGLTACKENATCTLNHLFRV